MEPYMINNQYIFTPTINLDLVELKNIILKNLNKPETDLATHQRYVKKEPYMVELKKQYPFLSGLYNIYATPPGYNVPIHICPERGCGLNIPILYTQDSHTIFYEPKNKLETSYDIPRIYHIVESEMNEVYRFTLTEPVVMNTSIPHSVIGGPKMTRVILSWSIDTSYEETKKLMGVL